MKPKQTKQTRVPLKSKRTAVAVDTKKKNVKVEQQQQSKRSFFPKVFYRLLEDKNSQDYIHWSTDGTRVFLVDVEGFSREVLGNYFKHSQYLSFVRQLHLYDFSKSTLQGQVIISHPKFLRASPELLSEIKSKKITKVEALKAENERLKEKCDRKLEKSLSKAGAERGGFAIPNSFPTDLENSFPDLKDYAQAEGLDESRSSFSSFEPGSKSLLDLNWTINSQLFEFPTGDSPSNADHKFKETSSFGEPSFAQEEVSESKSKRICFPKIFYRILEHEECHDFIRWSKDGTYVFIFDIDGFSTTVLPKFFKHGKYLSFVRQLHTYHFKKKKIQNQVIISHKYFLRSKPELLSCITKNASDVQTTETIEDLEARNEHLEEIGRQLAMVQTFSQPKADFVESACSSTDSAFTEVSEVEEEGSKAKEEGEEELLEEASQPDDEELPDQYELQAQEQENLGLNHQNALCVISFRDQVETVTQPDNSSQVQEEIEKAFFPGFGSTQSTVCDVFDSHSNQFRTYLDFPMEIDLWNGLFKGFASYQVSNFEDFVEDSFSRNRDVGPESGP